MSFYTSVVRYGNSILYRGYNSTGQRVYRRDKDFKPVFYVQSQKETGWKSLDGRDVLPVQMDSMREAKEWLAMNEEVSGRYIFGNKNYLQQYITQKFPRDIEFKRDLIDVGTIDIETEYEDGFPTPSEASQRILSITYKSSKDDTYRVWAYGDFDREKALIQPVAYYRCRDEASLLNKFLDFWGSESACPDVVTGWNIRFFDIPYLVNRTAKILGVESIKRFSPWGMVDYRQITRRGKAEDTYEIKGVE
jgi:DNA polymerase elongation subunit (family B)